MQKWVSVGTAIVMMVGLAFGAMAEQDKDGDRIYVKGTKIYRGSSPKQILAVEKNDLCKPNLTDEEMIKAFIDISVVGGTTLSVDLHGFNADATAIDPDHVATILKIKEGANYRWMPMIVRVLATLEDADAQTRMNAVLTTAKTFQENFSILFQIDGPDSQELAEAFRKAARDLTVVAPRGGHIDLVLDPDHAWRRRPALVRGSIPPDGSLARHAALPDTPASYAALERHSAQPIEFEPWIVSKVGLTWEETLDGWQVLYNGRGMDAWSVTGRRKDGFINKDGHIRWNGRGGGSLQTRDRYDDFILRLQWKLHRKGANSGIFLRAPRENRESKMGFEFQLMGDYGEEPHKNGTGAIYDVLAPASNPSRPVGQWNDLEIYLNGPHYKATLNGVVIQNINFDENEELKHRLREGFIALQDHGNPASFRNIRVKRL